MKALGSWIQKFKNKDRVKHDTFNSSNDSWLLQQIGKRRKQFFYWNFLHILGSSLLWLILFDLLLPNFGFYFSFILAITVFALLMYKFYIQPQSKLREQTLTKENLGYFLEFFQPDLDSQNKSKDPAPIEKTIHTLNQSMEKIHQNRIQILKSQFVFLIITIFLTGILFRPDWFNWNLFLNYHKGNFVKLNIIEGSSDLSRNDSTTKEYELNPSTPLTLKLNSENVIEILIKSTEISRQPKPTPPTLKLETISPDSNESSTELLFEWNKEEPNSIVANIQLNLDRSAVLKIPDLWGEKPLAAIHIEKVYPPTVNAKILNLPAISTESFDDTQSVIFQIDVQSNVALQEVALQIRSSEKTYREIVHKIESAENKTIKTDYSLNLAPYMDQDTEQFEIIVEAIDRTSPVPLRGESERFALKALTAYGKHQEALSSFKELQVKLRNLQSEEKSKSQTWEELENSEKNAYIKSEKSPYFDFNDRMKIDRFSEQISAAIEKKDSILAMDIETDLSYFLLEHEAINQSERDRDFFGAIRNFSRLIDQSQPDKNAELIHTNQKKLNEFLAERHSIWALRVKQLNASKIPTQWKDIQSERYFPQKIQGVVTNFFSNQKLTSQAQLTKLSEEYKLWIEALEEAEQKAAQEAMQNSKANLSQVLNQIKELQKRQNGVVNSLDSPSYEESNKTSASANSVENTWPSIRAESSSIANTTKELEAQMRAIFPQAAKRIKFAEESMQKSIEAGNTNNFEGAESFADMAGRLLRLASSDAQKQSEDRKNRSRRTRLNSDQNYGKGTVLGGDIEISQKYTVDPRYREHIMDDVKTSILQSPEELTDRDKLELDYYLQKTLR